MNSQKTVMFDLDGTVLDTLPDLALAANHALESLGFPKQSIETVRRAIGHGIRNLLKDLMHCDDPDTLERCRSVFQEFYERNKTLTTRPYAGITDLLNKLKSQGCKLILISNKYDGAAKQLVTHFFGSVFDGIYGSRDDVAAKPDRAIFDLVCGEHGVCPDGAILYIGDSEVDREFAANCGMTFIAVDWGFRTREELRECGADVIVSDIAALEKAICDALPKE